MGLPTGWWSQLVALTDQGSQTLFGSDTSSCTTTTTYIIRHPHTACKNTGAEATCIGIGCTCSHHVQGTLCQPAIPPHQQHQVTHFGVIAAEAHGTLQPPPELLQLAAPARQARGGRRGCQHRRQQHRHKHQAPLARHADDGLRSRLREHGGGRKSRSWTARGAPAPAVAGFARSDVLVDPRCVCACWRTPWPSRRSAAASQHATVAVNSRAGPPTVDRPVCTTEQQTEKAACSPGEGRR